MAVTYGLGFSPVWSSFDLVGRPIGGGVLKSFNSLNPDEPKAIYQDPAGNFPYPITGINFDENGNAPGPFYFKFDDAEPDSLYNLYLYDAQDNLVWNINNVLPTGGGGGGTVNQALNINNLIKNNVLYRNVGSVASPLPLNFVIAPSNHEQFNFGPTVDSAPYIPNGDIRFIKNNLNATDSFNVNNFVLGEEPFAVSDNTPVQYFNYTCTVNTGSETFKVVQFPIQAKVQNLSNREVTATIWARNNTTSNDLSFGVYQFFGSGGSPSNSVVNTLGAPFTPPTGTWERFDISGTIADVGGKTLGTNGNDCLFLQLNLPLNAICNIDFCLPGLFQGNLVPSFYFESYDEINTIISADRTGKINLELTPYSDTNYKLGYIPYNGTSIGNASSGATGRANVDTYFLFSYLWNNVSQPSSNARCVVSGGLGSSASADFAANKTITLADYNGKAVGLIGNNGTSNYELAQTAGSETKTLTVGQLPPHHHTIFGGQNFSGGSNAFGANSNTPPIAVSTSGDTGSGDPFSVLQPIGFFSAWIKL